MTIDDIRSGDVGYVIGGGASGAAPLWAHFGRQGWTWVQSLVDAEVFDTKERADAYRKGDHGIKEAKECLAPEARKSVRTFRVSHQWMVDACR